MKKSAGQKTVKWGVKHVLYEWEPHGIRELGKRIDAAIRRAVLAERKACRVLVRGGLQGLSDFDSAAAARDAADAKKGKR